MMKFCQRGPTSFLCEKKLQRIAVTEMQEIYRIIIMNNKRKQQRIMNQREQRQPVQLERWHKIVPTPERQKAPVLTGRVNTSRISRRPHMEAEVGKRWIEDRITQRKTLKRKMYGHGRPLMSTDIKK